MSLFTTLDGRREAATSRRERLAVLVASVAGAVLVVTGVLVLILYM